MESFYSRRDPIQLLKAGFTLVELMVVLAIIGTMTVVTLGSQSSFNKTIILSNTAYDIALTLRSAETFGVSGRAIGTVTNAGYGIHLQNGTVGSFLFFADVSPAASCSTPDCGAGDRLYTNEEDALVQTYSLGNGIVMTDFCVLLPSGAWPCASDPSSGISSLDIVFARPNPDAYMATRNASGVPTTGIILSCIKVASLQQMNVTQNIAIEKSGAIIINSSVCP